MLDCLEGAFYYFGVVELNQHLKKILKSLVAIFLLAAILSFIDFSVLWQTLSKITLGMFGFLMLISFALVYVSALKWKLFLKRLENDLSAFYLFKLYLLGYFTNLILPSYLGGDVVRSLYAGQGRSKHNALAATILERYTGLGAMITLGLVFMWIPKIVTWQVKLAVFLCALGLIVLTWIALSKKLLLALKRISKLDSVLKHLEKLQTAFKVFRGDTNLLLKALAYSFLFHTITVINTLACAYAVGWTDAPVLELFVVLPLILIIGALPVSPNGLGLQEGAIFFFLHMLGATPEQALGVGLILRAKSYVLALLGGIVWITHRDKMKPIKVAETSS